MLESRTLLFVRSIVGWVATLLFVMLGWLLFFYPASTAIEMTRLLVFEQ